jgi:hypothetical protein
MTNEQAQELKKSFQKGIEAIKNGDSTCCAACPNGDFPAGATANFAIRAAKDLGLDGNGLGYYPQYTRISILARAIELVDKNFPVVEAPAVEYKYLKRGNVIKEGDEYVTRDGYAVPSGYVGQKVNRKEATRMAYRRKVVAPVVKVEPLVPVAVPPVKEPVKKENSTASFVYLKLQNMLGANGKVLEAVRELISENEKLKAKLEAAYVAVK